MHPTEAGPDPGTRDTMTGTLEGAGWGLFLVWMGLCILADLGWSVFLLGTGALMLGGQAARRTLALPVDRLAVVLGSGLALAGVVHLTGLRWPWAAARGWVVPGLLIAFGIALVAKAWARHRRP